MEWADQRAIASLRGMSDPPAKAIELMAHVVGVERVWLSRIDSTKSPVAVWPNLTLDESERLLKENFDGYKRILGPLSAEGLQQPITYRNSAGDQFKSTVEDILTQVVSHGSYHRGQIAAAVRAAGGTPNPTDYIGYIRGSPAATRQN
jgi:uncharacterized damage-inducible protein DinB